MAWIYPDMGDVLSLSLIYCHKKQRGQSGASFKHVQNVNIGISHYQTNPEVKQFKKKVNDSKHDTLSKKKNI